MSPVNHQPRYNYDQALRAGRQALGLLAIHGERLKHRGIDESFRRNLERSVEILEAGTSLGSTRPPIDYETPRLKAQGELVAWIDSFREAIRIRYKDNPPMLQTFGVGLVIDPRDFSQIFNHTKTLIDVARNHLSSVAAAGILPADLDDAELMLDHIIALQQPQPMDDESSVVRNERRNARACIETAVDQILGAASMEYCREPRTQRLFYMILREQEEIG